jgi:GntR family transcriptional regulator
LRPGFVRAGSGSPGLTKSSLPQSLQHNITAEIAGPRYAQLLDTTIGSALLRIDRVAFVDDLPHHLLSVLLSPSR